MTEGNVVIENETSHPVKLVKDEAFADIVSLVSLEQDSIKKILKKSEDKTHLQHTKPV